MKELQQTKAKMKNDQSAMHLQVEDNQMLETDVFLVKKPVTKLDTNKHFSCIYIFADTLYLGTRSSKLYIYKLKSDHSNNNQFTLEQEKIVTPHCQIVSHVVANEKYFITIPQSDQESMISVWQTKNKMLTTALKGHKSQISKVSFMSNNKYLASASWDCTARIWGLDNLDRDEPLKVYTGTYPILQLKELNQQIIIFGGDDCYLVFWNWKKQEVIRRQFGHAGSVTYIQVLFPIIFTAGGDNKFKLWQVSQNLKTQEVINENPMLIFLPQYNFKKIQQEKKQYDSIIFGTKKGNQLFLMDRQGQIFVYHNNKSITQLKNQFQYNQNITGIDSYAGNLLVTTTKGCLKYFNISQEKNKMIKEVDQIKQNNTQINGFIKTQEINKSSDKKNSDQSSQTNLINIKNVAH